MLLCDRYRLTRPIAAGGMAQVWEATDLVLQRPVAVKVLKASLAAEPLADLAPVALRIGFDLADRGLIAGGVHLGLFGPRLRNRKNLAIAHSHAP